MYTTPELVRESLPLDGDTPTADFADMIAQVSGEMNDRLGFRYAGFNENAHEEAWRNGDGSSRLVLPRPGADIVGDLVVTVSGVELLPTDYELEPGGRYLLRLSGSTTPGSWPIGYRNILVSYYRFRVPPALVLRCTIEVVRAWRGRQAGYADVIGSAGMSEQRYRSGFEQPTLDLIDRLVVDRGNGGPSWVSM